MANTADNQGIKNSWSLISFAKAHGSLHLANFVNKDTGEEFKSCVFIDPASGGKTLVGFSSKLGELNAQNIVRNKHNLQVVQLESGTFKLCAQGDNAWEEVDLGL